MEEIRLKLDYNCFPIWIYKDGILYDNDLPKELSDDEILDKKLVELQDEYDNLFLDDGSLFTFNGFQDSKSREKFINKMVKIEYELRAKVGNIYQIINEVNI